ncbi:GNAT family N-acetyltransferase [Dellaglioa sp. P0083]|uniref:GNAT family N-acetyltransferase n=1 Tax=Dellaglioa kimchii TaxID=3344667 RepID=UPI0038D38392
MTQSSIQLYRYDRKYLSEITTLFNQTIQEINQQDYSQLEINEWVQNNPNLNTWHRRLSESFTLLAIKDLKVIGFGNLEVTGHIDMLFVESSMIRQHIGALILTELTNYQRNELQINVQTVEASITAVSFFEHCGFKIIKRQDNYRHQQNLVNYQMVREI